MLNLIEKQIELEKQMTSSANDKYKREIEKAKENGQASTIKSNRLIISRIIDDYAEKIKNYIDEIEQGKASQHTTAYNCLKEFKDIKIIAYLSLRAIINSLYKNPKIHNVINSISETLETELCFAKFKNQNQEYYKKLIDDLNSRNASLNWKYTVLTYKFSEKENFFIPKWTVREKQHIGLVLLELLQGFDIIETRFQTENNKKIKYILPTKTFLDTIEDLDNSFKGLDPVYLPMVVKPKDWSGVYEGGYLSPFIKKCKFIKHYDREYLKRLEDDKPETCFNAVNLIQSTKWKINKNVLEVVKELWNKDLGMAGLPKREDMEIPSYPYPNIEKENLTQEQKEEIKQWKYRATFCHRENVKSRSLRLSTVQIINTADNFSKYDEIYFPHNVDFRGRVYPIPVLLQPQGCDLAKGLLTFAEGKKLDENSVKWLKIHCANTYGNDKISFDERINWVNKNIEKIKNIALDPINNLQDWIQADKPFQFLASCFELQGYLNNPDEFISCLPVAMDGTNNGLQHYSVLLKDEIAGQFVNLMDSDKPHDIYSIIADKLIQKLQNSQDKELSKKWLELGINRKLTKRPVMTLPYGATARSRREYIKEYLCENYSMEYILKHFNENSKAPLTLNSICYFLEKLLWEAIKECLPKTIECMDYLRQIAKIITEKNLVIEWYTPLGLLVNQTNYSHTKTDIRTEIAGKLRTIKVRTNRQKLDVLKQENGICPNFIHSLDSSCLMLYVLRCNELNINSFALVHDSYGVLAADVEKSNKILREAFCEIYTSFNVLEKFIEDITFNLAPEDKEKLPKKLNYGNLDISCVLNSKYFFN